MLVAGVSAGVGRAIEGEARARAAWWVWVCMVMRGGIIDVAAIGEASEMLTANVGVSGKEQKEKENEMGGGDARCTLAAGGGAGYTTGKTERRGTRAGRRDSGLWERG